MQPDFYRLFETYVKGIKPGNGNQYTGFCPFHPDRKKRSFSFNDENGLWNCFAVCGNGNAYQFAQKHNHPNPGQYLTNGYSKMNNAQIPNIPKTTTPNPSIKKDGDIGQNNPLKQAHLDVINNLERLDSNYNENRSLIPEFWRKKMYSELRVFFENGEFYFPHHNQKGEIITIQIHKGAQFGVGKSKWYAPHLFKNYQKDEPLYISEGLMDCITLLSNNYQATSNTTGATNHPKDLELFDGFKEIIIAYDHDKAGRDGAKKLSNAIKKRFIQAKVKVIQWDESLSEKWDVTDSFEHDGGKSFKEAVINANEKRADFVLSDSGNAQLLAQLHADKLHFNHTNNSWLVWNGQYWKPDEMKERIQLAQDVSKYTQEKALTIADSREKMAMVTFGIRSENMANMESMLRVASSMPKVATTEKDWDRNTRLFQCDNGTLSLDDGLFKDGKPHYRISKTCGIDYKPNAKAPVFDQFLIDIMDGDEDLAGFLLMCLGYSMSGLMDEQCMFILNGSGANGKSVLLDLMSHVLGDYHVHTRFDAFLKKYNNTSSNDLARLSGARFVSANESGVGKNWDEERIKEITGGDQITARYLYGEYFDFRSNIKLWCATNNLPKTDDLTDAFWRRMIVIPFDRKFKGKDRNPNILAELKGESSGIINRLYEGFKNWQEKTLQTKPARVVNAVNEYKVESDVVAQWVEEMNVQKEGFEDKKPAKAVYQEYVFWHNANAPGKPVSTTMFGKRMNALDLGSEKIGGFKYYIGLQYNKEDSRTVEGVF